MTIPIYIAASSHPSERDRVTAAFTATRMLGLEPYDWRVRHRPTAEMTREERCDAARVDSEHDTDAEALDAIRAWMEVA